MDIGEVERIGNREIPQYKPAPTMVPIEPEPNERQTVPVPPPQRETVPA